MIQRPDASRWPCVLRVPGRVEMLRSLPKVHPTGALHLAIRMKLSVIIVNYNVRAYLEQCLRTVHEAMKGIEGDVFVVDNLSTDGSVEMVREKFPMVKLIANTGERRLQPGEQPGHPRQRGANMWCC